MDNITAVLTGATGGIGNAIAKELCRHGASIVLVGRNKNKLEALSASLQQAYPQVHVYNYSCELSDPSNRKGLLSFLETIPEDINLLINNAGISTFGLYASQSEAVITHQFQVNALYPLLLTRQFLAYFERKSIDGQIVNIGSTFGNIAYPGFTAYSASKFALRGASEALSREYADSNIRIRYFSPRATQTSLNSSNVVQMNKALNVSMDNPDSVAQRFTGFLFSQKNIQHSGWPERFFVFINQILPGIVSHVLKKNLATIKKYIAQGQPSKSSD